MPDDGNPPRSGAADLEIRTARASDIDALARLEAETFALDRLSRRSMASLVRSPSAAALVAMRDSRLAGYALLLTRRGARKARLYSIAVAREAAGRGVGGALLQAVEREARRRGADRLSLEVRADNAGAIRLYERSGYERTGERQDYYEDGMKALLFERPLASAAPAGASGASKTPKAMSRAA